MQISPPAVRPVETCIGIVLKPIARPESLVKRDADPYGGNNLERSAEVLLSKMMRAEQGPSESYINREPPVLAAEDNSRDQGTDKPGGPRSLKRPGAGDQPRPHSPA